MRYVFPPAPPLTLPVDGTDALYPVARVFCVGRNYAEHAVEMGHDPDREPPFFFMKPASAVVPGGGSLPFPVATDDLHHEVELVVALGSGGERISVERALDHVFGYAVGLDMTRRDLQAQAKEMGRPWDMGKGFDRSAPMSPLRTAEAIGHPQADLAARQRRAAPGGRPGPADLEGSRDDRLPVHPRRAAAR
jgi:fumarylpyruvate hydrolase